MTTRTHHATIAAVATAALLWAPAGPVGATSCAAAPDGSARAIVSGVEQLWSDRPFFETYDFAITGTVTAIETDDTPGDTHGMTDVHVDVINGFGIETVAPTMVVVERDPGWLNGYPFMVGQTYFIPLLAVGPDGQQNYSFLCDPISQLTPAEAAELPGLAVDGVTVAVPAPAPAPRDADDTGGSSLGPWLGGGVTLGLLAAVAAGATMRRRREQLAAV